MALNIFKSNYRSGQAAVESTAKALADRITTSSVPADELSNIHWDVLSFSRSHPSALDFPLHVLRQMTPLLPSDIKTGHGSGAEGARQSFSWFLKDMVRSLDGHGTTEPEGVGNSDDKGWEYEGNEYANVVFTRDEVTGNLDGVLEKVLNLQQDRKQTITAWAVEGRAHALDVAKIGKGADAWITQVFFTALQPALSAGEGMPPWSKADFVAACVGIRATVKTVLDEMPSETRDERLKAWTDGLREFLLEGEHATDDEHKTYRDGDFALKYHAAVSA